MSERADNLLQVNSAFSNIQPAPAANTVTNLRGHQSRASYKEKNTASVLFGFFGGR